MTTEPTVDLDGERQAYLARRRAELCTARARGVLERAGWGAGREDLAAAVAELHPHLTAGDRAATVTRAGELQAEARSSTRRIVAPAASIAPAAPAPVPRDGTAHLECPVKRRQEEAMGSTTIDQEDRQRVRDAVRAALQEDPQANGAAVHRRLAEQGITLASQTFYAAYWTPIRKELGIGPPPRGRRSSPAPRRRNGRRSDVTPARNARGKAGPEAAAVAAPDAPPAAARAAATEPVQPGGAYAHAPEYLTPDHLRVVPVDRGRCRVLVDVEAPAGAAFALAAAVADHLSHLDRKEVA